MKLRNQILLAAILPVVVLVALSVTGQRLSVPFLGRDYVVRLSLTGAGDILELPRVSGPDGADFPLIIIDPGHGGFDYGATGGQYREKDIVLGLALELRERLLEGGDIRVAMTRDSDRFLALEERLAVTHELGADLFLSIHADSAGEATDVAGASIYTLSEAASSAAAARFAARENAADRVNGVKLSGHGREVDTILFDLSRRRTQTQSAALAELIERSGEGLIGFHPQAQRSASLVVLRSPDVPSVLFEAGFVTNEQDAETLASEEGREKFAEATANAIRAYFLRQDPVNLAGDS
ncbi:N-acetylmuramoyl-L-alanine amidase [Altererythrobacter sp. MF3-039]|uniref:N-acetylmuramoyl-L-alanine amidase family protein n=1 Tax=Altererythrobacter sp. MF3-039 TaxID=3252901 RepID=UPI00390C8515